MEYKLGSLQQFLLELQTIHQFSQSQKRPLLGPSLFSWLKAPSFTHDKCIYFPCLYIKLARDSSVIVKTDGSFAALTTQE